MIERLYSRFDRAEIWAVGTLRQGIDRAKYEHLFMTLGFKRAGPRISILFQRPFMSEDTKLVCKVRRPRALYLWLCPCWPEHRDPASSSISLYHGGRV